MISIRIRHLSNGGREADTKRHPYWLRSSDAREHKLHNIGKLRRVLGFPPYTSANCGCYTPEHRRPGLAPCSTYKGTCGWGSRASQRKILCFTNGTVFQVGRPSSSHEDITLRTPRMRTPSKELRRCCRDGDPDMKISPL